MRTESRNLDFTDLQQVTYGDGGGTWFHETALEQLLVKVKENKRLVLENRQQTQNIAENQALLII